MFLFSRKNKQLIEELIEPKGELDILPNLTLAERIARGKYELVKNYTGKYFSVEFTEEYLPVSIPKGYHTEFNLSFSTDVLWIENGPFRPSNIAELLAYGEKYPETQKRFQVVAMGSEVETWMSDIFLPVLQYSGLGFIYLERRGKHPSLRQCLSSRTLFLAVRS